MVFSYNALFIHPTYEIMLDTEFTVPTLFKLLPFLFYYDNSKLLYKSFIFIIENLTFKVINKYSIELLGLSGLEKSLGLLSKNINNLDTGIVTTYALYILVGLILYIIVPYIYNVDESLLLLILLASLTLIKFNEK